MFPHRCRWRVALGLAFVAAMALALIAAPAAAGEILIAVAGPASGRFSPWTEEIRRGVERSVADLNAEGGVLGQSLSVIVDDDACDQTGGEASARRLIAKRANLVVGHPCASAAIAAANLYTAAQLLLIAPMVRHASLTAKRSQTLVFRLAGRDDRQGETAAAWLLAHAPNRRVAIIHDRTAYAKSVAEPAAKALVAAGIAYPLVLTIVASRRDYPEIAERLRAENTEAAFFAGFPDEAAIILRGLEKAGAPTAFLGADALATLDFAATAKRAPRLLQALVPTEPGGPRLERRVEAAILAWARAAKAANTLAAPDVAAHLLAPLATTAAASQPQAEIWFDQAGDAIGPSYAPAISDGTSWRRED